MDNVEKMAKALKIAGLTLHEITGDCPLGMEIWADDDNPMGPCYDVCDNGIEPVCWGNLLTARAEQDDVRPLVGEITRAARIGRNRVYQFVPLKKVGNGL